MSIKRTAAKILLPDLARTFLKPTAMVNALISSGFSYRRQDMFRDANTAIGWAKYRIALEESPGIPASKRDTIPSWNMDEYQRYKLYGTSSWYDPVSGQLIKKESSMYSDVLWDEDEMNEQEFADLFADDDERYKGLTFVGFEIFGVEHNVDLSHQILSRR